MAYRPSSTKPSEKASVENPCVKFAQSQGVQVLKVNPIWYAGWNDRIFFIPGGIITIVEFKRPGGKSSPKQEDRHRKLLRDGYDHHVIDNKEAGIILLKDRIERGRANLADSPHYWIGVEPGKVHEAGDEVGAGTHKRRTVSRSRAKKD